MEVIKTKIIAMSLLAIVSILIGFLPLKIGKYFFNDDKIWKRTFTSVLLCFGGGVLFATSFIHMLPEVRENIEESGVDFDGAPMAEILICAGFFFIYFIEETVHFFLESGEHPHQDETIKIHQSYSNELYSRQNFEGTSATSKNMEGATASNSSSDKRCQNNASFYTKSSLRDFFTVLALSFHAVFEGLAVGLETDSKDVWLLFAGIGIIITSNSGTGSTYFLVVAVLQALAGGTIIYVVVFEILERERSKNVSGLAQLFFVILGFCVLMSVEMVVAGDDHNHSRDDEHTNITTFKPQH